MEYIIDAKSILDTEELLNILSLSVFNPTKERLIYRAQQYMNVDNTKIFALKNETNYLGVIVISNNDNAEIEILDIAVAGSMQKSGKGSKLISYIIEEMKPTW